MCLWTSKYWRVNTGHLIRLKSPKVPVPCLRGYIHVWVCIYICVTSLISYIVCLYICMCASLGYTYICLYGTSPYYIFSSYFFFICLLHMYVYVYLYIYTYIKHTHICVYMALLFTISFSSQFSLLHNTKVNLKSILSSDVCSNPTLC